MRSRQCAGGTTPNVKSTTHECFVVSSRNIGLVLTIMALSTVYMTACAPRIIDYDYW